MSGDATQTLPRRASAPSFDEYMLRGAPDEFPSPSGPASIEAGDVEFWGVERKQLLDRRAQLRIRQILVVTAMLAAMLLMVVLVSGVESENDGSTVAAEASSPALVEAEAPGLRSSGVDPDLGTQSLALANSPILGLSGEYSEPSQATEFQGSTAITSIEALESPITTAPTTAVPTTATPTTAAPTTAAPTTAAPTTAAPATETPATEASTDDASGSADASTAPASAEAEQAAAAESEQETEAGTETEAEAAVEPIQEPTEPAHPEGWVDAGHGVYVPPVMLEIRRCESTHNYTAANAHSSARGAYQFLRGSWADYGHRDRYGVAEAHLATPAQQDEAAVITWQRSGTRPWNASKHCWG